MLYRDANTALAAMEALNSLLLSPSPAFSHWLMATQPSACLATNCWHITEAEGREGEGREGEGREGEGREGEGREGERQKASEEEYEASPDANSLREVIYTSTCFNFPSTKSPPSLPFPPLPLSSLCHHCHRR